MAGGMGKRLNEYVEDYVVFDLETTGLSPERDEIIEISALRVRGRRVQEEFSTLVNPGRPIPSAVSRVNRITDEMVKEAPSIKPVLEDFFAFAGQDILVGHNIHTFDMLFLQNRGERALGEKVANDYVDTLYLARACLPGLSHYRLTDVAEYFKIGTKGAHRALNDCRMNQQCYEKLGELWKEKKQTSPGRAASRQDGMLCPECGSLLVKRKGRYGEFIGCSAFPRCRYTARSLSCF